MPPDSTPPTEPNTSGSMWATAARFSYVGIFFGVAVVIGYLFGHWIERRWGGAPWPSLGGVLVGIVTGFRELYRLAKQASRK